MYVHSWDGHDSPPIIKGSVATSLGSLTNSLSRALFCLNDEPLNS